jgi:hypothetical protein
VPRARHESSRAHRESPRARRELPRARRKLPRARRKLPRARRKLPRARRELPRARRKLPRARRKSPRARRESPRARRKSSRARRKSSRARRKSPRSDSVSGAAHCMSARYAERIRKTCRARSASFAEIARLALLGRTADPALDRALAWRRGARACSTRSSAPASPRHLACSCDRRSRRTAARSRHRQRALSIQESIMAQ